MSRLPSTSPSTTMISDRQESEVSAEPQNPTPQRDLYKDLEDMLLEDENEKDKPVELSIEEKRARILEDGSRMALFRNQPILRAAPRDQRSWHPPRHPMWKPGGSSTQRDRA